MYAVITTGGKQYKVSPGDIIVVEKLLGDAGKKIKLDKVLMVGEEGKKPEVGLPLLSSAAVNCEVIEQSRSDKIIVFKKKRRQGYKRKKGHRQDQTVLRVLDINGKGAVKTSSVDKKPKVTKPQVAESPAANAEKPKKTISEPKPSRTDGKKTKESELEEKEIKNAGMKKTRAPAKKKTASTKKSSKAKAENNTDGEKKKSGKKISGSKK